MRAFCESSCHKSFCSQYQKASINTFLWMWCLFVWKGKIGKKRWTHHHDSPHGWVAINKMWIIYGRVSIKKNWNIIRFYFSFVPSWQPNRLLSIFPPPNISDWNICLFFLGSCKRNTSHHFAWKVTILIYQVITPRPVVNNFGGAIYRRHRKKTGFSKLLQYNILVVTK